MGFLYYFLSWNKFHICLNILAKQNKNPQTVIIVYKVYSLYSPEARKEKLTLAIVPLFEIICFFISWSMFASPLDY